MLGRFAAAVMVIVGAVGFGHAICQENQVELEHLKKQKRMLLYMIREISFLHRPIQEVFLAIYSKLDEPYSNFMYGIFCEMDKDEGVSMQDAWNKMVEKVQLEKTGLRKSKITLDMIRDSVGCGEDTMQIEALKLVEMEIEDTIDKMQKEKAEKYKLIHTLSILAGIFCVVLFI